MTLRRVLAEMQRQARRAAREREREQRTAIREHSAAIKRLQQAQKASARAKAQLERAAASERKRLEKEAREAHLAVREAEVEERNLELEEILFEIDSLLATTLEVDDYFDLEKLRVVVEHPPFDRSDLEVPVPPAAPIPDPPKPTLVLPDPPKGLARLLFGERRHERETKKAQEAHEQALLEWQTQCKDTRARRQANETAHANSEADRLAALKVERDRYARECATRDADGAERNAQLDQLIANLGYGTADAVQEYISIVLSNSVYPDHFAVRHEYEFEPNSAELRLKAIVPGPSAIPSIKTYKYVKSADEIAEVALSQKVCRDRYAAAIHQVALRSIHEVFESDRRGLIKTISLEVGTQTIDPSTGREAYIPFVAVAAERDAFLEFDLSAVVPGLTLQRLGAAISKNPFGLVAIETTGVRRS